jgi:tetratricopeptide (TPR) repeat protein
MARTVLEESRPLSRSCIWSLQRRFFQDQGLEAWTQGVVPHYVSSNPFLARTYGRLMTAFLRDWWREIDPREPIHVVELGAGAGRLGYHLLRQAGGSGLDGLPIRYVLTDVSERTVEEWSRQPRLRALADQGRLDFARFDAEEPGEIELRHSGLRLTAAAIRNPLLLIANYFFDSIPQDVFLMTDGEIQQGLVSVVSPRDEEADRESPDLLSRVSLEYSYEPADAAHHYEEPAFNRLLTEYRDQLDATHLAFPSVALRCIEHFRKLSGDRLLLLSADKGYLHGEELLSRGAPGFSRHGSISMSVNYHALARYFAQADGVALGAERRQASLRVCAFALGRPAGELAGLRQAFEDTVETQGPDDFFLIKKAMQATHESLSAEQALAFLRFSGCDANIFWGVAERLLALVPEMNMATRHDLGRTVRRVWELYLPIGEERDLAFQIALILAAIDQISAALDLFTESLRLHGDHPVTLYNMALCQIRLRQLPAALEAVEKALELEPKYLEARALRIRLQAELDQPETR